VYVCHCRVVTDREIGAAIAGGAADVCAVAEACGAGVRCGGCLPEVRAMLAKQGLPTDEHLKVADIRAFLVGRFAAADEVSA
jgi:bacterioferritin-associated ferredoxin